MRVVEFTAWRVRLPLKMRVSHALASRDDSENLLVRCRLVDGTEGWGEAVPRPYVTGETIEGCLTQFSRTAFDPLFQAFPTGWSDVAAMCDAWRPAVEQEDPRGVLGNAVRAAVELSLLDAWGKKFGEPVSEFARHVPEAQSIATFDAEAFHGLRYSGAVTAQSRWGEWRSALKMRLFGFRFCKVKVGLPDADDAARLRRIRRVVGSSMDLRLDANAGWTFEQTAAMLDRLEPLGVSCLEQPTPHEALGELSSLRRRISTPIMLDESLCSIPDAKRAVDLDACDLFNLRLSKCGGFLNCLRLAAFAHQAGLGVQLGCHPGESPILSAAGRHWVRAAPGVRYLEGSFDRFLLKTRLTAEDLTFRYGGRTSPLTSPGLGVTVLLPEVERLAQAPPIVRR